MTWLPDHRVIHGPDSDCDGCRPPETTARTAAAPRADAHGTFSVSPDLVIQLGSNRK